LNCSDAVPDHVSLDHGSSIFDEALETFPGGLLVAFPLDFELDYVLFLSLANAMSGDGFDAIPAPFLGFCRFRLLSLLFLLSQVLVELILSG